jgi:hypothetical protein
VTASITFGGSQLVLAAITLWNEDYVPTAWQTVLTYWAALVISVLVNIFFNKSVHWSQKPVNGHPADMVFAVSIRHLEKLNTLCLYWTGASVIM